jgi:signal transduction histidine kinase
MSTRPNARVVSYLRVWSRVAAVFAAAVGVVTLVGVALHSTALSRISVGTGVAFLLAGTAIWLLRDAGKTSPAALRYVLPFALLLYAVIALAQVSLGLSIATERSTAVCLALVAAALLVIDLRGRQLGSLSHLFAGVGWFIAYTALLIHAFQPLNLLPRRSIGISLLTAVTLAVLCTGVLALRPDRGWVAIFSSETPGGLLLRRVLPVVFFLPFPVSYLRLWGQRVGWYGREFGVAVPAIATALFFLVVILWCARSINRLSEHRELLESKLRQTQKMEAVGQLAGGVAHDFNNLLGVVLGYADMLLSEPKLEPVMSERLEEIRRAAEKATGLTRQLLAFGRQQVLKPVVLDLNRVVAENQTLLARLLPEDIELQFHPAPGQVKVRADRIQIEQVLLNLCVNARDAMPDGGTLTIKTGSANLTCSDAPVRPGQYTMIEVTDTGVGMDEKTQARVFDPFFTTKERDKGTGLGLATVYGIVDQSGGCIYVDSKPARGTTFRIYLPEVDAPEYVSVREATPETLAGTETILVVEDSPALRELFRHSLKASGYTVLEAGTGDEALQIVDTHAGPIHILVTDVIMPGMGGRELATRFKEKRPLSRVLYVSGYPDETIARRGVIDSGVTLLLKPFGPVEFIRKVREELDQAS